MLKKPGTVVGAHNLSTGETETGRSIELFGQSVWPVNLAERMS